MVHRIDAWELNRVDFARIIEAARPGNGPNNNAEKKSPEKRAPKRG
jgi:hypothetical protein